MGDFFSRIWHGAAWYPELWRDSVDDDIRLMREAGINLVRVGEFAWSSMEPQEGKYDLAWLHEAFDKCHAAGISIVLCTPTPTPPRWLTLKYPEVLRIDVDGRPFEHGSRQHVSHTSEKYRQFSRSITEKLAREFGTHPALAAWQTDNEWLCHVDGDYSASARTQWHAWLERKYKTVEKLNEAWSTRIWSEDYPSFDSIPMPAKTPFDAAPGSPIGVHHASLQVEWLRFTNDTVVAFQDEQVEIIRRHSRAPITHNHVSLERAWPEPLFANLDCAATDPYLAHDDIWHVFRTLDWMRGAKMKTDGSTVPYVIMETSPSHNGSRTPGHKTHPHGFLAAEALLLLGMGGNTFSYWLWRQQRSGVEMCHGAVLTAWGTPSVGFKNVQAVSELLKKIEPILLEIPPARADIAIHESHNARALFRAEPLWRSYNGWTTPIREIYRPLMELGIWRDVRFESADVSAYEVVLSPFMPGLSDELLDRMERFVRAGGTWIVGPMSGCRTLLGTVPTDAGLGRIDALAGVKTLWPVGIDACRGDLVDRQFELGWYCFGLETASPDCHVLGRYLDGPAAGAAWCTQRQLGRGQIILLAAHAPGQFRGVAETLLRDVNLARYRSTWGTTIIPREGGGRRAWLIVNWDGNGGSATLPDSGKDLLTGAHLDRGEIKVPPFGTFAVVAQ